jgi:hypothetical protein
LDLVNEAMLFVDPLGPTSSQLVLQWLRLSNAGERISLNISNQANNAKRLRSIPLHPPREVVESRPVKFQASQ